MPIKFYIAGIGIFDLVCSCNLDLDPMTFIYELIRIPWRYTEYAHMNFLLQGFRKLSSDRDRQTDTTEIIYHATSRVVNKVL